MAFRNGCGTKSHEKFFFRKKPLFMELKKFMRIPQKLISDRVISCFPILAARANTPQGYGAPTQVQL
jgi:hypothetical protein